MPTKTATKKKATKKAPAKKKVAKKVAAKRTISKKPDSKKKVVAKKTTPVKKSVAPKKKAATTSRKQAARQIKTVNRKKTASRTVAVTEKANRKTKKLLHELVEVPTESNLPPVEEKSPEINNLKIIAPGMENKSLQRAAVRNYDNHHIRLSNKKGGIKPTGKKPLW